HRESYAGFLEFDPVRGAPRTGSTRRSGEFSNVTSGAFYSAINRWLDAVLNRRDVASELAAQIIERPSGPTARILRGALQTPWMDSFLPQIAGSAVQPATRAVAYETLIAGQASWPNGWRWR
ncbi:MAG: hypothetical protein KGQ75_15910, partial [Sphingomonadales bacterium]|nr:hypothetical protein [Sphingomonadales bacterium]